MPPNVDIYARVEHRDERVLRAFLDSFLDGWQDDGAWLDAEPVGEALDRAFSEPESTFARYGRSSSDRVPQVIVAFGRDGSMVLGLTIDGEDEAAAIDTAEVLIDQLIVKVGGSAAIAAWEEPPPLDRDEWDSVVGTLGSRLVAVRP
jgi:hypothetical protein